MGTVVVSTEALSVRRRTNTYRPVPPLESSHPFGERPSKATRRAAAPFSNCVVPSTGRPQTWHSAGVRAFANNSERPASAQVLKAIEQENLVSVCLRGLVIFSVFAVATRAFEPN
jgi:hypothetical protein